MEYVFNAWTKIYDIIRKSKVKLLLCDYDGTLTAIQNSPEMAKLPDDTRQILLRLAHKPGLKVGIISGRALADIKEMVGISGIIYAGNHGFEIDGPGIVFIHPLSDELKSIMRVISAVLDRTLGKIKGVKVEDKGMTLSVHYRLVDEDKLPQVKSMFENTVHTAKQLGKIRTSAGKKVHEVRPAVEWHKGKAVQMIHQKFSAPHKKERMLTIYLGDDLTDEDAFKAVNELEGISILVEETTNLSSANYYLNSSAEVKVFLTELSKII